jgi:hypothetical protein
MIAKAREINKAHTTFIDSILRYEHKGRIHAEINQLRNHRRRHGHWKIFLSEPKPSADSCKKQGSRT